MAAFLISSNKCNQNKYTNKCQNYHLFFIEKAKKFEKKDNKGYNFSCQYLVFGRSNGKDISKISKSELIQTMVTGIFKLLNRRFIIFMAVKNCLSSLKYIIGFVESDSKEKFSTGSNCGS